MSKELTVEQRRWPLEVHHTKLVKPCFMDFHLHTKSTAMLEQKKGPPSKCCHKV